MGDKIPGVPDGWELVAFRKPNEGDYLISWDGQIELWNKRESGYVFAIIRKIEKPATYRPFANAEEYLPHWGKPIRTKDGTGYDSVASTSVTGVYVSSGTKTFWYSMEEGFSKFEFADGTPSGVKIYE